MSVVQMRALYGDIQPGGYVGSYVGQIGVIKRGDVWVTEFDASANWAATPSVWLAPNGQITTFSNKGVAAVQIPNCIVTGVPNMTIPYLGLSFSAM